MKILEDPPLEVESKLPWFIEAFLYPAGRHGLIQIGIFVVGVLLTKLISRIASLVLEFYAMVVMIGLYVLLIGYILFYFGYCIYQSSRGARRAPPIAVHHTPGRWDFVAQVGLVLGCAAVCFWPIGLYYGFTERTDSTFWIMVAAGAIFFPMALLAGILFDATHALNPIFIVVSIVKAFGAYCLLLVSLCLLGGVAAGAIRLLCHMPVLGTAVSSAACLYLLLVAAHLLGRFYWLNKYKLDWGL